LGNGRSNLGDLSLSLSQATANLLRPPKTAGETTRTETWSINGIAVNNTPNAIRSPAANLKFRLLGLILTISKDLSSAASLFITVTDGAAVVFRVDVSAVAFAALGQETVIPFYPTENGYLSTTAGNVLYLTLSNNITTGKIGISCWGTEEAV
jgi:hypothetical protein